MKITVDIKIDGLFCGKDCPFLRENYPQTVCGIFGKDVKRTTYGYDRLPECKNQAK